MGTTTADDAGTNRWALDWPDEKQTADRLGDHMAARYRHLRRVVERLGEERVGHALLERLLCAESLRDEVRAYEQVTSSLVRLALTGRVVRQLQALNGVLDAVSTSWGMNELEEPKGWELALEEEREARIDQFGERLAALRRDDADAAVASEIETEAHQEEVLALLVDAICEYGGPALKDDYRKGGDDVLTPWENMTMLRAFGLVARYANVVVVGLPRWFVAPLDVGSTRGPFRWGYDVLVPTHGDQERLIVEANTWSRLDHPHVAKFLGACHVGDTLLFAHEKVKPMIVYVAEVNDRAMVWRRLYEVALGLQYLHDHGLACERLDVNSVFCTQYEAKAVLLGVGLAELDGQRSRGDTDGSLGNDQCGDDYRTSRRAELVSSDVYALGVLVLNMLYQVAPSTQAERAAFHEAVRFRDVLVARPEFVVEAEWLVVERIRLSASDGAHGLRLVLDCMNEFLAQQRYWLDATDDALPSQPCADRSLVAAASGVSPLVAMLRDGTDRQKENAAGALRDLALNADNKVSIAAAGAISALVPLLRGGTDGQKANAAATLVTLAVDTHNAVPIAEAGAIGALMVLVRDDTDDQKAYAAGALADLVRRGTDHQKEHATSVLMSLAMNTHTCASITAVDNVIGPLVALVQGGTDAQKVVAAGALMNLATNADNKVSVAAAGAIAPLVALVQVGTDGQKANATGTLMSLAVNMHLGESIVAAGAVDPLVSLVRSGTERQREHAAGALRNLAVSPGNRVAVTAAGAIDPLVALAIDGTENQKENAASALINLMVDADNKISYDASGAIDPLVAMARDGNDRHKTSAVRVLRALAVNSENLALIAAAGAIDPLVALLRDGTDDQQENAASTLMDLAADAANAASIVAAGAIRPLVRLVRDGTECQKEAAARALMHLAVNADNKVSIAATGAIGPLVALVRNGTDGQKENAAGALMNLAANARNKASITATGATTPLVALVRDGTRRQKENAAGALRVLSYNTHNSVLITEAGAIDPLADLLRNGSYLERVHAAGALKNLALPTAKMVASGGFSWDSPAPATSYWAI